MDENEIYAIGLGACFIFSNRWIATFKSEEKIDTLMEKAIDESIEIFQRVVERSKNNKSKENTDV